MGHATVREVSLVIGNAEYPPGEGREMLEAVKNGHD